MTTITKEHVIEGLTTIVEHYGMDYEYIDQLDATEDEGTYREDTRNYMECEYVVEDTDALGTTVRPGCLIGVLMHEIFEVPLSVLEINGPIDEVVDEITCRTGYDFTLDAVVALSNAQNAQDTGKEWGVALEAAIRS